MSSGDSKELKVGQEASAKVGDVFFEYKNDSSLNEDAKSFALNLLILTDMEIILEYSYPGKKEAVKTFTYPLSRKVLKYENLEFEILSVSGDDIHYKRLR